MTPVTETDWASLTSTTDDDEGVQQEPDQGDDFDGSDPEFELTVKLHWEHIEQGQQHPEDTNPGCQWYFEGPELNNLAYDGQFQREGETPREEVHVTVCGTERRRQEPLCEHRERRGHRDESGHLTQ